jgi:hypothetical protein
MRRSLILGGVLVTALGALVVPAGAANEDATTGTHQFIVLYADGASLADGQAAVAAAGGTIKTENAVIGLA